MQRRTLIGAAVVLVGIGLWYAFRPERLFVNKVVNERFDAGAVASAGGAAKPALAAAASPAAVAAGQFHSNAHETRGTATIYTLPTGKRILRLTSFRTSNGPDVHVYLVAASDATDNETVKRSGFVDLGSIKGNEGDQNYEVPADVDLATHRAVTIWCKRFGVNFGTAPLS
jgi:hypothetical protein